MRDLLFYDGTCGLCHWAVRVAATRDRAGVFAFAPLGGRTAAATLPPDTRASLPDSIVVLTTEGTLLVRSDAVVHVLARLGGGWRLGAAVIRAVPRVLRDAVYEIVARTRYGLFGRTTTACPLVPDHLRTRFLE